MYHSMGRFISASDTNTVISGSCALHGSVQDQITDCIFFTEIMAF